MNLWITAPRTEHFLKTQNDGLFNASKNVHKLSIKYLFFEKQKRFTRIYLEINLLPKMSLQFVCLNA